MVNSARTGGCAAPLVFARMNNALAEHGAGRATTPTPVKLIALLEAVKGVLAFCGALALHSVGPAALVQGIERLAHWLHLPKQSGASAWLTKALTPDSLALATVLLCAYASMRLIEAFGLWRGYAWAMWFGVIGAAAYVPFEIIALLRQWHWVTFTVLLVNLLVVAVLAWDLRRRATAQSVRSTGLRAEG